jgi:DNA topoisomerase I
VSRDLGDGEPTRPAVLACAARLLDVGLFRVGSEEYADDDHGVGLATVRRDHVSVRRETVVFDYPGKAGIRRVQEIRDPLTGDLVRALRRRRGGPPALLAYREHGRWHDLQSSDINDYLKQRAGEEFSAKDFRTWNASVLAAVSVAADGSPAVTKTARKRVIDRAVRGVSEMLGNTPAVARRSYIDPRVFDRYLSGWTIAGVVNSPRATDPSDDRHRRRLEAAVLDLLEDDRGSAALHHEPVPRAA